MKKIFTLMIAVFSLAMAFTSCSKDMEGVYAPKKKISEIIRKNTSVQQGQYVNTGYKEVWIWNGRLLASIGYENLSYGGPVSSTVYFHYDNKNRIKEEVLGGYKYVFDYDGDIIDEVKYYNQDGTEIRKFEFEHDGNKISAITIQDLDNDVKESMFSPLHFFLPANTAELLMKNPSKGTTRYELTWSGDNISKIEVSGPSATNESHYKYDGKINPYKGLYDLLDLGYAAIGSSNNPTQIVNHQNGSDDVTYDYTYTYEGDYPVKRQYKYVQDGKTWTAITEYRYLD